MVRHFESKFEVRKCEERDRIRGYAAVFFDRDDRGTETRLGRDMVERIDPDAFEESIARGDDVVALFNHDPNLVLGRRSAGTLELDTDERGLFFEVEPPDTQFARDLMTSLKRGDIRGSSFGFIAEDEDFEREGDVRIRRLRRARLVDVSPVTYPAYASTTSEARSAFERDFETYFARQESLRAFERRRALLEERGLL